MLNVLRNSGMKSRLAVLVLLVIMFYPLSWFVAAVSASAIFNFELSQLSRVIADNSINTNILLYMQAVLSMGMFILSSTVYSLLFYGRECSDLKISKAPNIKILSLVVIFVAASFPFINLITVINQNISLPDCMHSLETFMQNAEDEANQLTERFLLTDNFGRYIVNVIVMALIPAIGEELLFRGAFLNTLIDGKCGIHFSVLFSAFVFSALHFQFYGFIPRFILGAAFGYIVVYTRNIYYTICAHFINNLIAVTCYFLVAKNICDKDISLFGSTPGQWPLAFAGLVLSLFLVVKICKYKREKYC